MATHNRRRLPAILFVIGLALPALPALGTPPDHAPAHGLNNPGNAEKPDKPEKAQSAEAASQAGGTSQLCKDVVPEENTRSTSPVSISGAELSWSGSTLHYTVVEGFELEICLKSETIIELFGPFGQGTGSVSTQSGKDISHIGYLVTEVVNTTSEPPVEPDPPADQPPADETLTNDQPPADETPTDQQIEDESDSTHEGTPTTLPNDNRDTSDNAPAQDTPKDTQAAPETEVAAAVVNAPPASVPNSVSVAPVSPPAVVTSPPADATVAAVFVAPDTLPFTGAESTTHMAYGASILLAGAAFVLAGRERKIGRHESR